MQKTDTHPSWNARLERYDTSILWCIASSIMQVNEALELATASPRRSVKDRATAMINYFIMLQKDASFQAQNQHAITEATKTISEFTIS